MSSFSEKTNDHKLRSTSECFVRKQILLNLSHQETIIQSTAVYFCHDDRKPGKLAENEIMSRSSISNWFVRLLLIKDQASLVIEQRS